MAVINSFFMNQTNKNNKYLEDNTFPFNPKKIDIDTKTVYLGMIIQRLKASPPEIDLYPSFQRNNRLWNNTKQSRLIESILVRVPLPAFYFDGTNDDNWLVVDGLQRLSTLNRFVVTKDLKLENMEFLIELNGMKYDELSRELQRRIEETQIMAYIIKPGTPTDVKFTIFQRINTVGISLNAQEIRHALYQGIPSQFVTELANLPSFKRATNNINSKRMRDCDWVTRFISFYLLTYENYHSNLDLFLNEGMNSLYELTAAKLNELREVFDKSMNAAFQIFGDNAFRKDSSESKRKKPLNKAIFDVWSVTLARLTDNERQILVNHKELVNQEFIKLMNNNDYFIRAISQGTGDKGKVSARFGLVESLVNKILDKTP